MIDFIFAVSAEQRMIYYIPEGLHPGQLVSAGKRQHPVGENI
jgi:hypothetical protein